MSVFPKEITFKYPWRSYQQRVLSELSSHLADDHLHVIAPPGSGKTVLGLEVMLRMGEATLILAPTLAIRNQWISRFTELFLQTSTEPEWISRDIRNPGKITVVTYQGLHAACHDSQQKTLILEFEEETDIKVKEKSNFLNIEKILSGLEKQGVKTIILDEAHHLKNEWWQTLDRIKQKLKPKTVGLTATPPYDVSPLEWSRYMSMNGAIDAEISIPELVKAGDLCPHQDFLYLTEPTRAEAEEIRKIRQLGKDAYAELEHHEALLDAVSTHPYVIDPLNNDFHIQENIAFYSACLIFLSANGREIPVENFQLFAQPEAERKLVLPELDYEWMEELLKVFLFEEKGYFQSNYAELQESLLRKLKRVGIVERKTVRFENQAHILKCLNSSISKLKGIEDLVNFEYQQLGKSLRQVILADYVRKEYLSQLPINELTLQKIGVIPIFEQLRRNEKQGKVMAVLTGTLVILPRSAMEIFDKLCRDNPKPIAFSSQPLPYDKHYFLIQVNDQNRDGIVSLVTALFQIGEIEVLIGTKALLGEGWDAPAINSLILATVIGSFVSSNQMRGRAIRTSLEDPDKTSNIWHIASIDSSRKDGGEELEIMRRRFRNFVGISEKEEGGIENGLPRLGLAFDQQALGFSQLNSSTFSLAAQRSRLAAKWKLAIEKGTQLLEEIKVPYFEENQYEVQKAAQMKKTIRNMVVSLGAAVVFYLEWSSQSILKLSKYVGIGGSKAVLLMLGVGTLYFIRRSIRTFKYYTLYRDISLDIYYIGNALVKTLCASRIFSSPVSDLKVLTYADQNGSVFCHLDGGSSYEKSMFVQMIQEIVDPIKEPRYILVRKSRVFKVIRQLDYHAVPELLGRKAALANSFLKHWQTEVGDAEIIFTRKVEGRRMLIRSKLSALSNHFSEDLSVQHVHIWR